MADSEMIPFLLITIPFLMGLGMMIFPSRFHQFFLLLTSAFYLVIAGKLTVPVLLDSTQTAEWTLSSLSSLGWSPTFRLDAVSGLFVLLTALTQLSVTAIQGKWFKDRPQLFSFFSFFMTSSLSAAFLSRDLFMFYVFFEAVFIPAFFMLGLWGSEGKGAATLKFILVSLAGSLMMLLSIILLGWESFKRTGTFNLDVYHLTQVLGSFSADQRALLFAGFFLAFAIKVPLVPFHGWLPDAYSVAPTSATIWMSAVMSKLGVIGFVRFASPLFSETIKQFQPELLFLSAISIVFAAFVAWRQTDPKRMLAYSSVSHLGFVLLGVFSGSEIGTQAAIFLSVAHGFTSAALFALQEFNQHRNSMGGLAQTAPKLSTFGFVLVLAAVALPGSANFIGEFMVLKACFDVNVWACLMASLGVIFGAVYMLNYFQHHFFGEQKNQDNPKKDLSWVEAVALVPAVVLIIVLGFKPNLILKSIGGANNGQSYSAR